MIIMILHLQKLLYSLRKALKEKSKQDVHDYIDRYVLLWFALSSKWFLWLFEISNYHSKPYTIKKDPSCWWRHWKLIKKVIFNVSSYEELVNKLTSKRYTKKQGFKGMLLHILMNNTKEEMKDCFPINYLHILKMNRNGQNYLKNNQKNMII